jgi:hypothetical protein
MPRWDGETWLCEVATCQTVNMVLRKRCRSCGAAHPGPVHPDPAINAEVQGDMREAARSDEQAGLLR